MPVVPCAALFIRGVLVLQLMREAETHLMQLVNMLRRPGIAALPGTVAIVAVKAVGTIALQRPVFYSKVLPVLLAVASTQVQDGTFNFA